MLYLRRSAHECVAQLFLVACIGGALWRYSASRSRCRCCSRPHGSGVRPHAVRRPAVGTSARQVVGASVVRGRRGDGHPDSPRRPRARANDAPPAARPAGRQSIRLATANAAARSARLHGQQQPDDADATALFVLPTDASILTQLQPT